MNNAVDKSQFKYVWNNQRGHFNVNLDSPTYNKETRKMEHHYRLVGTAREKNGEISFGRKYLLETGKSQTSFPEISKTLAMGERLLIDKVIKDTGIRPFLKKAFSEQDAQKVLDLAFYAVATGEPLSASEPWLDDRGLTGIPDSTIADLLPRLSQDKVSTFLQQWMDRKCQKQTLCYDITSVSSYSRGNQYVEYGYNRDREKLAQINLALLSSKESGTPVWFSPLNGSMNDSRTLKDMVTRLGKMDIRPFAFIMDRGFYSEGNLQFVADEGIKFIIPVPDSIRWAQKLIFENKAKMFLNAEGYITKDNGKIMQSITVFVPQKDGSRYWLHIYFDPDLRDSSEQRFYARYAQCMKEMEEENISEGNEEFCREFFKYGYKTKNGRKVIPIKSFQDYFAENSFGYWCIYTNAEKDAKKALECYRTRNSIEVLFDDLKNTLDGDRLRVHSAASMEGRLFIQFVSLILLTEIRKVIKEKGNTFSKYCTNPRGVFRRISSFSRITFKGRYKDVYSVPTKAQRLIFEAFGIDIPLSEEPSC